MLQFTNNTNAAVVRENEVRINGCLIGMVSDEEGSQILTLMQQMITGQAGKIAGYAGSTNTVAQKKWDDTVEGTVLMDDGNVVVTEVSSGLGLKKSYRLYIKCKVKAVRSGIKYSATKDYGASFSGNYNKGILHWTFPSKAKAQAFIKAQKARAAAK